MYVKVGIATKNIYFKYQTTNGYSGDDTSSFVKLITGDTVDNRTLERLTAELSKAQSEVKEWQTKHKQVTLVINFFNF